MNNKIGSGSPEGVVRACPGVLYLDTDDQRTWVKESGSGTTGWTHRNIHTTGSGSPVGVVSGYAGDTYIDEDTDNKYQLKSDGDTDWI